MAELQVVSFRCRGHPDIRGSHHKSVEFTREAEITGRATCVLGVDARLRPDSLAGFRGPVTLTISAGGHTDTINAVANPGFDPAGRVVVRTSRHHSADTFALAADKGAGQLDRHLIDRLADPHAIVTVTVAERHAAARPTARRPAIPPRQADTGVSLLPLQLAVVRAYEPAVGHCVLPVNPGADTTVVASALRAARMSGTAAVWSADADRLADSLAQAEDVLAEQSLLLAVEPTSRGGFTLTGTAAEVRRGWWELGAPPGIAVLVAAGGEPHHDVPAHDDLIAALLAQGVPSRTIAAALGELPGQDYRRAYRHVLALKSGAAGGGHSATEGR